MAVPADAPLYADHVKVYPRAVHGPVRRAKWAVLSLCLGVYYLAPWLRWDRGPGRPDQALLIDMDARRAFIFDFELWPTEVYYITGLLLLGALGIFFVTSLFGRMWCGFACPQTVWTDLFLLAERTIEGDRAQRMRLDEAPWTWSKFGVKAAKHSVWLVIAAATGGAWIMYFQDAPTVVPALLTGEASHASYFFAGLFTTTTYVLGGLAREQVCTYMCPWPRFQAAMVDEQTLTVAYRDWRGETRGKHKKGESWEGRGDCVDCRACVHACPTGIDIRDGLQLECIGCGLCIDACDEIMGKVGRPPGLLAWETYANMAARRQGASAKLRLVRPRTIMHACVISVVGAVMIGALAMRTHVDVSVIADRSPLFVRHSDGSIHNAYTVKVSNKRPDGRVYRLALEGLAGARLAIAGTDDAETAGAEGVMLAVGPDTVGTFRAFVRLDAREARPELDFAVTVVDVLSRETAIGRAVFHGPPPSVAEARR